LRDAPPPGLPSRGGPPPGPPLQPPPPVGPPSAAIVGTLLASLLTAALLAWYMAKPIRSLRFAFDAASAERLDYRVAPLMGRRQDELADLGRAFDRMVERLQASMDRQRRLLHDVSHEVRSPLARLQAAAGLLRQRQSTEETTVERIEEEIARIDHLVGDLLNLSRIEAGELAEEVQDVDLHELVAQIVSDANFEAQSSGRTVTWMEGSAASMRARPEMLHVAFENIVRNALKHAPDSPLVRIETSVDAVRSRYTFRVEDSGPGVRSDELATLFTPFFRAAGAAAADGYGLGLAIARRSIEAHGGAIRAQNLPAGGLAVEIVLPLNEDPATLDV
jgi:signal transduction histidine kinase